MFFAYACVSTAQVLVQQWNLYYNTTPCWHVFMVKYVDIEAATLYFIIPPETIRLFKKDNCQSQFFYLFLFSTFIWIIEKVRTQ